MSAKKQKLNHFFVNKTKEEAKYNVCTMTWKFIPFKVLVRKCCESLFRLGLLKYR